MESRADTLIDGFFDLSSSHSGGVLGRDRARITLHGDYLRCSGFTDEKIPLCKDARIEWPFF